MQLELLLMSDCVRKIRKCPGPGNIASGDMYISRNTLLKNLELLKSYLLKYDEFSLSGAHFLELKPMEINYSVELLVLSSVVQMDPSLLLAVLNTIF